MNVLFRQDASVKYKPVGAQGRRFFGTDGAQAIPNGGLVYLGFMQYVVSLVVVALYPCLWTAADTSTPGRSGSRSRGFPLCSSTRPTRPSSVPGCST